MSWPALKCNLAQCTVVVLSGTYQGQTGVVREDDWRFVYITIADGEIKTSRHNVRVLKESVCVPA